MDLVSSVKDVLDIRDQTRPHQSKGDFIVSTGRMYLESGAAAFLLGYANGRSPVAGQNHAEILGAPVDLGAFVLANGAIAIGLVGSHAEDVTNLASGALSVYLARLGTGMGNEGRIKALSGGTTSKQMGSGGFMGGAPIGRVTQLGGYSMTG